MTTARMSGYATDPEALQEYYRGAADEICVLVQVESPAAVAAIPEVHHPARAPGAVTHAQLRPPARCQIAATPGVDGIFIGPSDLAAAMGLIGQVGHPKVQQAVREAIAACKAAGLPAGCISGDETVCRALLDEHGASFVAVGTDLMLLASRVRSLAGTLK